MYVNSCFQGQFSGRIFRHTLVYGALTKWILVPSIGSKFHDNWGNASHTSLGRVDSKMATPQCGGQPLLPVLALPSWRKGYWLQSLQPIGFFLLHYGTFFSHNFFFPTVTECLPLPGIIFPILSSLARSTSEILF